VWEGPEFFEHQGPSFGGSSPGGVQREHPLDLAADSKTSAFSTSFRVRRRPETFCLLYPARSARWHASVHFISQLSPISAVLSFVGTSVNCKREAQSERNRPLDLKWTPPKTSAKHCMLRRFPACKSGSRPREDLKRRGRAHARLIPSEATDNEATRKAQKRREGSSEKVERLMNKNQDGLISWRSWTRATVGVRRNRRNI